MVINLQSFAPVTWKHPLNRLSNKKAFGFEPQQLLLESGHWSKARTETVKSQKIPTCKLLLNKREPKRPCMGGQKDHLLAPLLTYFKWEMGKVVEQAQAFRQNTWCIFWKRNYTVEQQCNEDGDTNLSKLCTKILYLLITFFYLSHPHFSNPSQLSLTLESKKGSYSHAIISENPYLHSETAATLLVLAATRTGTVCSVMPRSAEIQTNACHAQVRFRGLVLSLGPQRWLWGRRRKAA